MMIVHITRDGDAVHAQGHRVALHLGGEPELKRRVLATIAQLDDPPDEIRFERRGLSVAPLPNALPGALPPLPEPRPAPPSLLAVNSSAPTNPTPVTATSSPRSHKRRS
jgi:hypothetical protein